MKIKLFKEEKNPPDGCVLVESFDCAAKSARKARVDQAKGIYVG